MNRNSIPSAANIILWMMSVVLVLASCKKEQNPPNPGGPGNPTNPSSLSISGIKPTTGTYNTEVIIRGTGFGSNKANDSVYINGVAEFVSGVTDTEIAVIVQPYTGTGDLVVKVAGIQKTGPVFTYIYSVQTSQYAGKTNSDIDIGSYLDGPAAQAGFWLPAGLVLDHTGNLFVYDAGNSFIREITPPNNSGGAIVSTYSDVGYKWSTFYGIPPSVVYGLSGQPGYFFAGSVIVSDGKGVELIPPPNKSAGGALTPFLSVNYGWTPTGSVMDAAGNIYAGSNNDVVIIYKSGPVSWVSFGNPAVGYVIGAAGNVDGTYFLDDADQPIPADEPSFKGPTDVALDLEGNILVADRGNNKIRKIDPTTGVVSTFAGNGDNLEKDGTGAGASLSAPTLITTDSAGNSYVIDASSTGFNLRKITPAGVVSTLCTQCMVSPAGLVSDPLGHNLYYTEYIQGVVYKASIL
jgi:serine/threonine protein kinase, bacterial